MKKMTEYQMMVWKIYLAPFSAHFVISLVRLFNESLMRRASKQIRAPPPSQEERKRQKQKKSFQDPLGKLELTVHFFYSSLLY